MLKQPEVNLIVSKIIGSEENQCLTDRRRDLGHLIDPNMRKRGVISLLIWLEGEMLQLAENTRNGNPFSEYLDLKGAFDLDEILGHLSALFPLQEKFLTWLKILKVLQTVKQCEKKLPAAIKEWIEQFRNFIKERMPQQKVASTNSPPKPIRESLQVTTGKLQSLMKKITTGTSYDLSTEFNRLAATILDSCDVQLLSQIIHTHGVYLDRNGKGFDMPLSVETLVELGNALAAAKKASRSQHLSAAIWGLCIAEVGQVVILALGDELLSREQIPTESLHVVATALERIIPNTECDEMQSLEPLQALFFRVSMRIIEIHQESLDSPHSP